MKARFIKATRLWIGCSHGGMECPTDFFIEQCVFGVLGNGVIRANGNLY